MPVAAFNNIISSFKKSSGADLRLDTSSDMQNYNGSMSGGRVIPHNAPSSPTPYIKNEPVDSPPDLTRGFSHNGMEAYTMSGNNNYNHSSNFGQSYDSIDPSALTMSPVLGGESHGTMPRSIPITQNGGFAPSYSNFSSQGMGTYGISNDELLSLDLTKNELNGYSPGENVAIGEYDLLLVHDSGLGGDIGPGYSHTPDHLAESPFTRSYQAQNFRQMQSLNGLESPAYASPIGRHGIDIYNSHKSPLSKSPNTPKTPGLGALSLNGTESSSLPPQPIQNHHMGIHRHKQSIPTNQWDNTPLSQNSYLDSPLSSPGIGSSGHAQISEMMKAKHASLPTNPKVEPGTASSYQTQEMKRRRRRESHNLVERRRRDNINERIQELSHLVPHHRLEDEKIRKHLQNNSPLSPTISATGGSPPRATSMLAGGMGRRASGVAAAGVPADDKDKGPNKGDILNGSVSWTRDLMWCLHEKYKQEDKLREWATKNNVPFPFEPTEDDKRMKSELLASVEKNSTVTKKFQYSRGPGSGLRVPGFTDISGTAITVGAPGVSSPSLSPVHAVVGARSSSGSAATSLSRVHSQQPQFWSNEDSIFKEEEFGIMDLS